MRNVLIILGCMFAFSANAQDIQGLGINSKRIICGGGSYIEPLYQVESKDLVKEENKITLQEYVERLYQISSLWYNKGAQITMKSGEYPYIVKRKDGDREVYQKGSSKELINYTQEDIESIEYLKGLEDYRGIYIGIVAIVFKEKAK
ncbi:hypothetical protein HX017_07510 [Myroides marinus]|uniref:Uncharacterized protein n=1 Tax=Myroides marinus TaxID=703342 RepID=A0A163ZQI8_9FLAO|nr:hypothetical protein [Myroides marinus]KZE82247.1 hypothetical protein AV926_07250 [Myroides marinus]MDM1350210.1 hypothetical protein [Myroides marinus]MDM1357417.1 hypothetical protein [Myroides marinus]MDM1364796.1 hypothetical protein [Myroides marinus]MDM1370000.1 hypothetical protein [Myroides marinus]